jgi:membrane-bound ClpP family serine protease
MANVKYWRKMTWALVLWSAGIVVFMVIGGPGISSGAIGVLGLIVLVIVWFMTRPLWRSGHGASFRQVSAVDAPFRAPKSVTEE